MKIIISLGWGVQSFTMATMVAFGDLPPVDAAVHSDTTHERAATYEFAKRWTPWLEEHGVRVVTVSDAKAASQVFQGKMIPLYTATLQDGGVVRKGRAFRTCTHRWKIIPIRRWLQANRDHQPVEQWMGISMDEIQRIRPSEVKYITHRWPLVEKKMTRADCESYLKEHGLEVPCKSSCTFCPFHSEAVWAEMRETSPQEWSDVVALDKSIRDMRLPTKLYLRRNCLPMDYVERVVEEDYEDNENDECTGNCFL